MLSKEEVKHIASLARIGMSDSDLEKFSLDLTVILDWVRQLEEVDVDGIAPMSHTIGEVNITREDVARHLSDKSAIIDLFPEEKSGYGKVKSVF
ncbi:MAG: Asp-tRNA(Asn)/Glu-tRNA(Gln) amidotransferase subunit GatC [Candidatus Moranbacteria bacterium]|nr:Asp-tRNA(Asn)/Glu-tRNA(Gln) amidotransferase subunit GatC [Candidatus Moranbacteria bacterium]